MYVTPRDNKQVIKLITLIERERGGELGRWVRGWIWGVIVLIN